MSDDPNYNLNQPVYNKSRKDKFILVFTLPPILRDLNVPLIGTERSENTIKQDAMQYSIWGSPVPDIMVPSITKNYDGQILKVTSQTRTAYPGITVNFTVDNRFSNWWIIWKWLDQMNKHRESGMPEYFGQWNNLHNGIDTLKADHTKYDNREGIELAQKLGKQNISNNSNLVMQNDYFAYQTTMTVYGLDEYNNKTVQFDYLHAFPTNLNGIQYNYRDEKEIESSFQFEFNQLDVKLIGPPY